MHVVMSLVHMELMCKTGALVVGDLSFGLPVGFTLLPNDSTT